MAFQHFRHEHPLALDSPPSRGCCGMCGILSYGEIYTCDKCPYFYIDKACAKLLPEIDHPFHPQHLLTFLAKPPYNSKKFQCSACGKMSSRRGIRSDSTYHCSQCKFDLDIGCAALTPIRTTESINHFIGEPHPLFLCKMEREISDIYCSGCSSVLDKDSIYVCLECKILLDKSCVELPKEIKKHPFHPNHTLTLLPRPPGNTKYLCCSACSKACYGLIYHCFDCEFNLDVNCPFLMPINTFNFAVAAAAADDDQQYQYVRHSHPLFLCKSTTKLSFLCSCEEALEENSILCCLECHRLLHKHCADLPVEIEHVFHRLHPLSLQLSSHKSYNNRRLKCQACLEEEDRGSKYFCDDCDFLIDVRCALSTPQTLRSELHRHPLAFFSLVAKDLCCTLCNLSGKTNLFRCVECDFNVHLLCIPRLPRVVSDGNHRHCLTLTESPVKDHEDEDEDAEFLCDTCEKERRLYDPTYYCAECHYVSHIQCVLSEVIRLMEEECSLAQSHGDKNEVVNKALTMEVEGTKSHEKLTANKQSILYSVAEIDEEIVALRAEVEEQESKVKTSREELKAFEEKFPQYADLFPEYSGLKDQNPDYPHSEFF